MGRSASDTVDSDGDDAHSDTGSVDASDGDESDDSDASNDADSDDADGDTNGGDDGDANGDGASDDGDGGALLLASPIIQGLPSPTRRPDRQARGFSSHSEQRSFHAYLLLLCRPASFPVHSTPR